MSLVSIETLYENQILQDHLMNVNPMTSASYQGTFWTSAVKVGTNWMWGSTGKMFVFTYYTATPGTLTSLRWYQGSGNWYTDVPATTQLGVICESLP